MPAVMTENQYDYVVIGAGIHGAGVTQAASAAGYRVLLLEQYAEAAQGTSSKSSKLIHGGLRYLESAEISLVKECLRERTLLLSNAPHLVKLKRFYIPVYKSTSRRPWKIAIGLWLYSLFSGRDYHRVQKKHWPLLDDLRTDDLEAVFSYCDAQTDDARLTRAVLASALSLGAEIRYNTSVQRGVRDAEGIAVQYQSDGHAHSLRAAVVINATGPWVSEVHYRLTAVGGLPIALVQGAHIVLPGKVSHPYYLESPGDRRAVFVLPWKDQVMVGTTETDFEGDPAGVTATDAEVCYLLEIYNHYFQQNMTISDVQASFAGLRVLPAGEGAAFTRSRDAVFVRDDATQPRVVSILGGKLTAYRATAEKLVQSLKPHLPEREVIADSRRLMLPMVD